MSPPAERLRKLALAYPGASEEFPWGERVVKVDGKIFVFLGDAKAAENVTMKLPLSNQAALSLPGAQPTGYRAVAKKRRITELEAHV